MGGGGGGAKKRKKQRKNRKKTLEKIRTFSIPVGLTIVFSIMIYFFFFSSPISFLGATNFVPKNRFPSSNTSRTHRFPSIDSKSYPKLHTILPPSRLLRSPVVSVNVSVFPVSPPHPLCRPTPSDVSFTRFFSVPEG